MNLNNQDKLRYHSIVLRNTQLLNAKTAQKGKLTARKRKRLKTAVKRTS